MRESFQKYKTRIKDFIFSKIKTLENQIFLIRRKRPSFIEIKKVHVLEEILSEQEIDPTTVQFKNKKNNYHCQKSNNSIELFYQTLFDIILNPA